MSFMNWSRVLWLDFKMLMILFLVVKKELIFIVCQPSIDIQKIPALITLNQLL